MRRMIAGAVLALAWAGAAGAQSLPYTPQGKVIDADKLVVQPADTAGNIFQSAGRYISRVVANTVENNGFVKTINNLLGRTPTTPSMVQPGFSPLPDPRTYQSTGYRNSFTPALPTSHTYGTTPK